MKKAEIIRYLILNATVAAPGEVISAPLLNSADRKALLEMKEHAKAIIATVDRST